MSFINKLSKSILGIMSPHQKANVIKASAEEIPLPMLSFAYALFKSKNAKLL